MRSMPCAIRLRRFDSREGALHHWGVLNPVLWPNFIYYLSRFYSSLWQLVLCRYVELLSNSLLPILNPHLAASSRTSEAIADFKSFIRQQHRSDACNDADDCFTQAVAGLRELTTDVRMLPPMAMGKGFLVQVSFEFWIALLCYAIVYAFDN